MKITKVEDAAYSNNYTYKFDVNNGELEIRAKKTNRGISIDGRTKSGKYKTDVLLKLTTKAIKEFAGTFGIS